LSALGRPGRARTLPTAATAGAPARPPARGGGLRRCGLACSALLLGVN
jgi:hypothetical protein